MTFGGFCQHFFNFSKKFEKKKIWSIFFSFGKKNHHLDKRSGRHEFGRLRIFRVLETLIFGVQGYFSQKLGKK